MSRVSRPFSVTSLPPRAVMGVLNVTPDSFSDGGQHLDPGAAIAHGHALAAAGSAIVDVGGESTRPGAEPVDATTELARVGPVVGALAEDGVVVSIDTTKASVAAAALRAGARLVNDVSAGRFDPAMLDTVAAADAGIVLVHLRGEPRTMQHEPRYHDVVGEVTDHLAERVGVAIRAGVRRDAILADPGIGFGKTADHNWELLAALDRIAAALDAPLLVGASRKRFLAPFAATDAAADRDDATLAVTVWAFTHGAAVVRVHDAAASVRAAAVLGAVFAHRGVPAGASA